MSDNKATPQKIEQHLKELRGLPSRLNCWIDILARCNGTKHGALTKDSRPSSIDLLKEHILLLDKTREICEYAEQLLGERKEMIREIYEEHGGGPCDDSCTYCSEYRAAERRVQEPAKPEP